MGTGRLKTEISMATEPEYNDRDVEWTRKQKKKVYTSRTKTIKGREGEKTRRRMKYMHDESLTYGFIF